MKLRELIEKFDNTTVIEVYDQEEGFLLCIKTGGFTLEQLRKFDDAEVIRLYGCMDSVNTIGVVAKVY